MIEEDIKQIIRLQGYIPYIKGGEYVSRSGKITDTTRVCASGIAAGSKKKQTLTLGRLTDIKALSEEGLIGLIESTFDRQPPAAEEAPKSDNPLTKEDVMRIVKAEGLLVEFRDHTELVMIHSYSNGKVNKTRSFGRFEKVRLMQEKALVELIRSKFAKESTNAAK